MTDLTAADLARIEAKHERRDDSFLDGEGNTRADTHCAEDQEGWPCDTARLVAAVRALVREILRAVDASAGNYGDCCFCLGDDRHGHGSPDGRYGHGEIAVRTGAQYLPVIYHQPGCVAVLARALLGDE